MGKLKSKGHIFILLAIMIGFCGEVSGISIPPILGVIRSDTTSTLFGSQILPLGDQNGDGYADFLVWDLRRSVYFFRGGNPLDTHVVARLDSVGNRISNVGDLNGDGYSDLLIGSLAPYKYKLRLFLLGPLFDSTPMMLFGSDSLASRGFDAHGHDLNRNGSDDIVTWSAQGTRVLLFELGANLDSVPDLVFRPTVLGLPEYTLYGWGIATGRFNGDSLWDLAISVNPDSFAHLNGKTCLFWGGLSFDTIPNLIINHPGAYKSGNEDFGKNLVNLGDVNGDGFDDLMVAPGNSYDTLQYIYFGGPGLSGTPNLIIADQVQATKPAGDINGDGYNDLITSRPEPSSAFGYVKIYYGGRSMDSLADITINVSEMPEYLTYLGEDVAGIGDVNGDGIGDYAVSAIDNSNRGVIYIFAGQKSPNDVPLSHEPSLPDGVELCQNYPNPFNATTQISFSVPKRARVKVTVTDVLGRVRGTLVDRVLDVGTYKATWDAERFASGTYICVLEAGNVKLTRKMVLVK